MTVWSLSSLKEAGYSHRIVTGILHSDPVPSCKDRRHSLCEGGPFGFAQGDKPHEYHSDILPTVSF